MTTHGDPDISMSLQKTARLLYINKSRFGGEWHSEPHIHACSEMFYCVSGRGQFNIEGSLHSVEPDDLVIVNPRVRHTELSYQANPLEYVVLGLEGIEFLQDRETQGYTVIKCRDLREDLLYLTGVLLREMDAEAEGSELICQNILEVLLVKVARRASVPLQIARTPARNRECAAAKQYLDENFRENITLDQLAAVTHLNKYYLAHTFQKEYNISPISYLLRRRIRESKILLAGTDHSLTRISGLVGFSSPSYFSQSFRRLEGMSPIEYRRTVRSRPETGTHR